MFQLRGTTSRQTPSTTLFQAAGNGSVATTPFEGISPLRFGVGLKCKKPPEFQGPFFASCDPLAGEGVF